MTNLSQACFAFQAARAGGIDELSGVLTDLGDALAPITSALSDSLSSLSCPELKEFDQGYFDIFPGFAQGASN